MAIDTYTRSFAEILTQVSKMKTKKEKVSFLLKECRTHDVTVLTPVSYVLCTGIQRFRRIIYDSI